MSRHLSGRCLSLVVALTFSTILGGARDCMGGRSGSISLGEDDAGPGETDMGTPPIDMGATPIDMGTTPIDMGTPSDGGALSDAAAPSDAGSTAPITGFSVASVGSTDNDFRIELRFDSDDTAYIVHYGEAGYPLITYESSALPWTELGLPDHATPGLGGCDVMPDGAFDSSGRLHYVYLRPNVSGSCGGHAALRYYSLIDNVVTSAPVDIDEVSPGIRAVVAADGSGTAHVNYTDPSGTLRYKRVTDAGASAAIAIPGVLYGKPIANFVDSADHFRMVYLTDARQLCQVAANATGFDAPTCVDASVVVRGSAAAMDASNTLHVTVYASDAWSYYTVSPSGTWTDRGALPGFGFDIAINPITNRPAIVGNGRGGPIYFSEFDGSSWLPTITTAIPGYAEGVTPSIAFTSSGVPHIAFQGWGANDLYYASPL